MGEVGGGNAAAVILHPHSTCAADDADGTAAVEGFYRVGEKILKKAFQKKPVAGDGKTAGLSIRVRLHLTAGLSIRARLHLAARRFKLQAQMNIPRRRQRLNLGAAI